MYIINFINILISLKVGLAFCNNNSLNTLNGKVIEIEGHLNNTHKNNIDLSYANINLEYSSIKEKSLTTKLDKKETNILKKKTNKNTNKKPSKKSPKGKKRIKTGDSNENKVKTIKKVRKKPSKTHLSDESNSISKSKSVESEEPKFQLKEGETLLDFSELAKIKSLDMDQDSTVSSQIKVETFTRANPLLNWNCSSLSLEEEQNISSGYLDKKISHVITHAEDFPEGGTQLLDDMRQYYCYLKHINRLVIDQVRRGKMLMKQLVEEDPEFTQIGFDTDELTEQFSWVKEEADMFEQLMDGICYQWKCLVARLKHK